ncbi:type II toxin-antitoxin system RelB/DinJ family antitoxin [Ursidibacter arcticus]
MNETYIRARIDNAIKNEATTALKAMGLTMSEFLRIAVTRVAKEKAIPFEVKVPNAVTLQAMQEAQDILSAKRALKSAEELFDELENSTR